MGLDALRALGAPAAPDPVERLGLVAKSMTADAGRVRLDALHVDHDYQRPMDRDKVQRMRQSRAWSQPIKVNQRPDGTLWIVDGQHRAAAAALEGETHIAAEVSFEDTQDEPQLTNIMAKVAPDRDQLVAAALLGAGARRVGKRLVLELGSAGRVAYTPHAGEFVGKAERGALVVHGGDALDIAKRVGVDSFLA